MNDSKEAAKEARSLAKRFQETMRINYRLVPLKFLMLFTYGGMAALHPFLTVHMKSIGLTLTESALIYALLPFVTCVGPPIGGAIADKIGNYKAVMIGVDVLSILFHLLMLIGVPSAAPPPPSLSSHPVSYLQATFSCRNASPLWSPPSPPECPTLVSVERPVERLAMDCQSNCTPVGGPAPFLCTETDYKGQCLPFDASTHSLSNVSMALVNGSIYLDTFVPSWSRDVKPTRKFRCVLEVGGECDVQCRLSGNIVVQCATPSALTGVNRLWTVVLYATFRVVSNVFIATLISILDAAAYQMSEEYGGDLGFQRMFSLFGMCLAPPISGFLVGVASQKRGAPDYAPAFYIFAGLHGMATIITLCSPISLRTGAQSIWRNVGKIIRRPKVSVFVVMMFFGGAAWGFLENFLFWFMEDMGSPKWLLGLTNTTSAIAAIPVLAVATLLMRYFGHIKILTFCFFIYGIRFLAYSFIYDPFLVLPVEVLEAFTTSLFAVTASVYGGKIAAEYLATIQGLVGSAHNAIGRGVGSLVGGVMFEKLKPRMTYRIFGSFYVVLGIIYLVLHYAWLRRLKDPKSAEALGPSADSGYPVEEIEKLHGLMPAVGGDPQHLSPDNEAALTRFAVMGALTRRYSQAPPLIHNCEPADPGHDHSSRRSSRRGSTLLPTVNYLIHRPSTHL
ncbi:major facilitator superfamily domain-containing protein 6-like [Paramacrobiotus metropolitanus]|uniref:major facilitator superfamily domain-containing protein 6-like n=1 Tax=Paramacrobiotus metropolitanus TaxID=2943436 RepID=UPI002445AC5C|nr:major facilitator superfamily domain-containing protein 6-like [Paramacrobiotus metropolitanus]